MDPIKSRQHPVCKLIRSLGDARNRRAKKLFVVEGGNGVAAALRARWPLERLIVTSSQMGAEWAALGEAVGVSSQTVDADIMEYLCEAQSAPDVLALARLPQPVAVPPLPEGLTLVIDGISDPGNVGALIRTADAAGASAVIVTESSADPFGPKAVRASAGSLFDVPPILFEDAGAQAIAQYLRSGSIPIAVAVAHEGVDCFQFRWPRQCALVMGHETRGVSDVFEAYAAGRVTIPMYGKAESLNVAAAGAVLVYAWRNGGGGS